MDFINKPVLEAWKATKRTFTEIIDSNDGARNAGISGQRNNYDHDRKRDSEQSGSPLAAGGGRKSRSSFGYVKGRHKSLESNLNVDCPDKERENRPVEYEGMSGVHNQRSTSTDSLDFAEVQTTPVSVSQLHQNTPKIRSKDKLNSERERNKHSWAKLRFGYLGRTFHSTDIGDSDDNGADQSPILPSRLDKTSPTYISNTSVGSPGKSKLSTRASRRSRGEIGQKGFDFRSRFRSNSSDRATMRRREREERDRTRRSSYSRSASYDANDDEEEENDNNTDDTGEDQTEKMKSKLLSMWNNVKYGWTVKSKTSFSIHKPIWFLGKCYHQRPEDPDPERAPGVDSVRSMVIELFKQDFSSRLWMTYRREFPTLAGSNFTSDCGWGCMLRSGQMLLAHSLILHFLGRDWNVYKEQTQEMLKYHRQIIRWFGDQPLDMSPFSVHRLVSIGQTNGKKAGDWYGPASVAHILKEAMDNAHELNPLLGQLCIYVAQDCTVYKQDLIDLCRSKSQKLLQPIYRDVSSDIHTPEKCTTTTQSGKDDTPSHHEQLPGSSPHVTKDHSQSTSDHLHSSRVGSRLAQSHQKSSMYGLPGVHWNESGSKNPGTRSTSHTSGPTTSYGCPEQRTSTDSLGSSNNRLNRITQASNVHVPTRTSSQLYPDLSSVEQKAPDGPLSTSPSNCINKDDDTNTCIKKGGHGNVEMTDVTNGDNYMQDDEDVFTAESHNLQMRDAGPLNEVVSAAQTGRYVSHDSERVTRQHVATGCSKSDFLIQEDGTGAGPSPSREDDKPWCAVVILIPVRLGGDEVNPVYVRAIQSLFTLDSCLGIIGGKPKHSLYFVGFQEEKLIHMDPHYCQQVVDMRSRDFPLWSFHCMSPRKMSITKMDPSCTVGFYIKTEKEFEQFCQVIPTVVSPLGTSTTDYPMFIIREGRCGDWQNGNTNTNRPERYLRVRHVDENGRLIAPVKESEDFVLLDS